MRIIYSSGSQILIRIDQGRSATTARVLKSRQRVGRLEIEGTHSQKWVLHILRELDLQTVVYRTTDRLKEVHGRGVRIDAGEGAGITTA
jgi:hypothetical protein